MTFWLAWPPGTVMIEMSSGEPAVTQELAEQVMALGGYLG